MTKLSGFLISCAIPAVNWPSEASFSVWTRRSCAFWRSVIASAALGLVTSDDHAIFRQGLRVVLGDLDPAVEILEAADFGEALAIAKDVQDLSLLLADLRMPQMDGFEGLRALRRLLPRTPIMVLSASEEAADLFGALESGASGYLPKSAPAPVILEALRLVLAGGVYVPRELVSGGGKPLVRTARSARSRRCSHATAA